LGALPRQHRLDGLGDALVDASIDRKLGVERELVDVEQRQCPAHDLLGAAERVAVERREQRCHVKRSGGCYRQRDLAGPWNQVGEHVARQAEALAGLKRLYRAARENLRRRLDRQLVLAREREAFGSGDGETHGTRSEANGRDRYSDRTALLGLEVQSLLAVLDAQRIVGRDRDFVTAGRPLDIVEVEPERRL